MRQQYPKSLICNMICYHVELLFMVEGFPQSLEVVLVSYVSQILCVRKIF